MTNQDRRFFTNALSLDHIGQLKYGWKMFEIFLSSFATLFVIIDPIGIAAISISLTDGKSFGQKRRIIITASFIAFVILLLFGLVGESFLNQIGISMAAFRVSGGILLFLTALEMLFGSRVERRSSIDTRNDPTVYPLAMPLLAGPGAMTAMILMMGENSGEISAQAIVIGMLALVLVITVILSLTIARFAHHLGETGIAILNRFLAIILAALATQFIADGIFEYIQGVAHG